MAITSVNHGVVTGDSSAPYESTAVIAAAPGAPIVAGDILLLTADAYEFPSSSGPRVMSAPAGWTPIFHEEFQLFPTTPTRRKIVAAWWGYAAGAVTSVKVTLSGGAYSFLDLRTVLTHIAGVSTAPTIGPVTRRENVDLGVGVSPWTLALPALKSTDSTLLCAVNGWDPTTYNGWTAGPNSGFAAFFYGDGAFSTSPVFPNSNGACAGVALVFSPPDPPHFGWHIGSHWGTNASSTKGRSGRWSGPH